jgi:FlaA1/EpsC-like NDP-sugar epimerase
LIQYQPAAMILMELAETPLYEVDYVLRNMGEGTKGTSIVSVIGDVRNAETLKQLFRNYDIQVVFHCAAYKHVPMMELNPGEAVLNNVLGTVQVANASRDAGVERFVMISTDKAVNPVNIMGATKRVAELYIQNLARTTDTHYITVRFGNVLGSNGSVIPLFQKQISEGGPVTVTHPEIIRYFMTIPEAAGLVVQAGVMGMEGEIFILDMGEPVKIKDLAEDVIRFAGLVPYKDIEIRYIGLRPGEKLFEELLLDGEGIQPTRHKKIHIALARNINLKTLIAQIERLCHAARANDRTNMDAVMAEILPEYRPVYTLSSPERKELPAPQHRATAPRDFAIDDRID